jgi:hypothetical protein
MVASLMSARANVGCSMFTTPSAKLFVKCSWKKSRAAGQRAHDLGPYKNGLDVGRIVR